MEYTTISVGFRVFNKNEEECYRLERRVLMNQGAYIQHDVT